MHFMQILHLNVVSTYSTYFLKNSEAILEKFLLIPSQWTLVQYCKHHEASEYHSYQEIVAQLQKSYDLFLVIWYKYHSF